MVDFHTHILPSIDDGAKNLEMSIKMIDELTIQGVEKIVLTPHFYSHKTSLDDFLKNRNSAYDNLLSHVKDSERLILASETYFTDYIFNYKAISDLFVGKSNYILLELPYTEAVSNKVVEKIDRFISTFNVTPIIAHVERYPEIINNAKMFQKIADLGCLFQMNLSSLETGFFKKKKLLKFIKSGLIHVIGTDCHNLTTRPPVYKKYADIIIENLGSDVLDRLNSNAGKVIN